jgi:AP-4 complex subunit mu-1
MISQFFVLSPRGDTIIAKKYRMDRADSNAHERSHMEAFFRKIKFWNDDIDDDGILGSNVGDGSHTGNNQTPSSSQADESNTKGNDSGNRDDKKSLGDAPPVFLMPDGLTYMHVKRNGLIFGCATARNVSAVTVVEVRERN